MTSTRVSCSVRESSSHEDCSPFLAQFTQECHEISFGRSYLGESPHGRDSTGKRMETLHVAAQDVAAQTSRRWTDLEGETGWSVPNVRQGKWIPLLRAGFTCDEQAARARHRKCHRDGDDVERRIMRVGRLISGNCLPQGRRWKEQRWLQVIRQRWTSCRMSVVDLSSHESHFHQT